MIKSTAKLGGFGLFVYSFYNLYGYIATLFRKTESLVATKITDYFKVINQSNRVGEPR